MEPRPDRPRPSGVRWALGVLALAACYFVAARLGLLLALDSVASPVWPPAGIALAALLLFGLRLWPGILLGELAANLSTGTPLLASTAMGLGNSAEAALATLLVIRFARGPQAFERAADVVRFAFVAATASLIGGTVGAVAACLGGLSPWSAFPALWGTWWLGDAAGALVVTPLVVLWTLRPALEPRWRPAERASLAALTLALGLLFALGAARPHLDPTPLGILVAAPVAWAAFRFGSREAVTASALVCALAVWGTVHGHGPFLRATTTESLLALQGFVAVITMTALALAAVVADRNRSQAALRDAHDLLGLRVSVRTAQLEQVLGRFRGLAEGVPLGIFHTNAEGRMDYANARWMEIAGCSVLDRDSVMATVHPDDLDGLRAAWRTALGTRSELRHEFRFLHADGSSRRVATRASPVQDAAGLEGYVGYVEDVTSLRAVEADARSAGSLLAATLEATQDGILVLDLAGRATGHNSNFARMWNVAGGPAAAADGNGGAPRPADALAVLMAQLRESPAFSLRLAALSATPEAESKETLETVDGRVVEGYSRPQWLDGRVVGRVWSFRDVTESRAAEQALRESEERMRLLIDGAKDHALFLLDAEGRVASWNPGAQRIHGYEAAEALGQPHAILFTAADRAAGRPQDALRTAAATGRFEEEGQRVRKDGTLFWADVVMTALRGPDGRLRGFSKVTRDITPRKVAEAQAREVERLGELHRFKEGFLRNAAHELGTPLTPLKLQVRVLRTMLANRPVGPEARSVEILDRNIERLHILVRDMLEAARLQSGRLPLKMRPMDLSHTVHDAVDTFQEAAIHAGILLDVESPPALPLQADPDRVGQVIYNLVSNAMKFTPAQGRIHVEVRVEGGEARVTVRDSGIGLTSGQAARLFQPFVQVHDADAVQVGGSGLGLYISRGIAESHGGTLAVQSEGSGQGCLFTLTLPLRVPATPAAVAPAAPAAQAEADAVHAAVATPFAAHAPTAP